MSSKLKKKTCDEKKKKGISDVNIYGMQVLWGWMMIIISFTLIGKITETV